MRSSPSSDVRRTQRPARRPALLGNHYFLDRFLVAIGAVLVSTAIGLAAHWATDYRAVLEAQAARHAGALTGPNRLTRRFDESVAPFDLDAPLFEQYVQLTVNYLTWEPIAYALIGCGVLAVVLEIRYR